MPPETHDSHAQIIRCFRSKPKATTSGHSVVTCERCFLYHHQSCVREEQHNGRPSKTGSKIKPSSKERKFTHGAYEQQQRSAYGDLSLSNQHLPQQT